MKRLFYCLLSLLTFLLIISPTFANPEDVTLLPLSKWQYKNVDGWGFYAYGGEFSWFGFVLHNATDSDYTVSLPVEADVNHLSRHKIVNTSYKVMDFGSKDFQRNDRPKIYFTDDFTLPKRSTYAVFMDIAGMQPYSRQWDTSVFFDYEIKDNSKSVTKNISGILTRDMYRSVPTKLVIMHPGVKELETVSFCRDYSQNDRKVTFNYALKNNTNDPILIEFAQSILLEGFSQTIPVQYLNCTVNGSSCTDRLGADVFWLLGSDTAVFQAEAALPDTQTQPNNNFHIKTSLRYDYNGQKKIPYGLGETRAACQAASPEPISPTKTPEATSVPTSIPTSIPTAVPTATPAPTLDIPAIPLENPGFCRNYIKEGNKISFSYTLTNISSVKIPVELATSLWIEGQPETIKIINTDCTTTGNSCKARIKNGILTLNANESVDISGEAVLKVNPPKQDFLIQTSLRYNYNGKNLIPFLIKNSNSVCSADIPVPEPEKPVSALETVKFCRTYDSSTGKVSFSYALKNNTTGTIPVELATTIAIQGQQRSLPIQYKNCVSAGKSCIARIKNGYLYLNAGETAELSGIVKLNNSPSTENFYIRTSLRYMDNHQRLTPFYIGQSADSCTSPHSVSLLKDPAVISRVITNDTEHDLKVEPGTILLQDKTISNYLGSVVIGSADGESMSSQSLIFSSGEDFTLPPFSTADITLIFEGEPDGPDHFNWEYRTNTAGQNTQGKQAPEDINNIQNMDEFFFRIGDPTNWLPPDFQHIQ